MVSWHTKKINFSFTDIDPVNPLYRETQRRAYNYASEFMENHEFKTNFIKWYKSKNLNSDHIENIPEYHFIQIGKMAWLLNNGAKFDESSQSYFDNRLIEIEELSKLHPPKVQIVKTETLKEKRQRRAEVYTPQIQFIELYNDLDDLMFENRMSDRELKGIINPRLKLMPEALYLLADHFKAKITEYTNAREPEYAEYFEKVSDAKLKKYQDFSQRIIQEINNLIRGNRKIKKQKDVEYDIDLINVSKVKGRSAIVVYDTKIKRLGIIKALIGKTLDINDNEIINIDITNSFFKTVRVPAKVLTQVKSSSLKRNEIILNEHIKGKSYPASPKINSDVVVIKIY